ncbi:MAG: hypothetical protein HDR43_01400, partial [Mycoplasma sp.]|nr:hypothetical protein [Mycoplasma sp.]
MKKESKKKLIKSTLVTSVVALTISPLAIAAGQQIIKDYKNLLNNNSLSRATEASWTDIPNINVATNDMFINTENIKSLSSVARGQMSTPYGWLGTYEKNTAMHPGGNVPSNTNTDKNYYDQGTLVHIGWDGSILWANNDSHIPIYSAKYHFNSNTIFVVRTRDQTGAGTSDNKTYLTIHDASTGKVLFSNTNSNNNSSGVSGWDFSRIFNNEFLDWTNREDFKNDLYYQDMISIGDNDDILWFYMPNPLKMKDTGKSNLVSIKTYSYDVVFSKDNNSLAKVFLIKNSDIENARNNNNSINTIYDVTNSIATEYQYSTTTASNIMLIAPLIPMSRHQLHSNNADTRAGRRDFKLMTFTHNQNDGSALVYQGSFQYNEDSNTIQRTVVSGGSNTNTGSPNLFNDSSSNNIFKFDSNGFNGGWKTWTNEFNNAMLIPTRNMFNENVVTFAYPYASPESSFSNSVVLPIFNIWQLSIDDKNAGNMNSIGGGSFTKAFNFGKEIYDAYTANNWGTQSPTSDTLMWYPWPGSVKTSTLATNNHYSQYTNQLYNRLINVSPYDNTIVYAARPNYTINYTFTTGIGDMLNGNSTFKSAFASFWIGRAFNNPSISTNTYVSNFTISNSISISTYGQINSDLVAGNNDEKINKIYQEGFWFDIKSIYTESIYGDYINLYFNVNGTLKDKPIENQNTKVNSSPIGMFRSNINNYSRDISQMLVKVTLNSSMNKIDIRDTNYSNYITSRANLSKWYPSMYQSLTQGANTVATQNLFTSNPSIVSKQVANNFGSNLNFNQNSPYELFSTWKTTSNYVYTPTSTYTISTNNNGQASTNLNLSTKFQLGSWTNSFISNASDIDKAKTIEIPITVPNVSWQFLSSWSTNAKLDGYNAPTNNDILGNMNLNWISNSDGQGNYGDNFASQNNMGYWVSNDGNLTFESISTTSNLELTNTNEINKYPLRVVFAINPDPDNSLSSDSSASTWLNKFKNENSGKFTKKYPLVGSNNETNFNDILKEYVDWKAQNLTYSTDINNPSLGSLGLGQITIDAYLELNPYWDKLNNEITIYTLPENTNTKILIDNTTNIKYIYKDDYQNSRFIYKQNSTTFSNNNEYGFGVNVSDLNSSWVNTPNSSLNLKMLVDSTKVADVLVRDDSTTTNNIFTAKYVEGSTDIILEPKADKVDWAKTHLPTYSLMTGTGIIFEYKTKEENSDWTTFSGNDIYKYNTNDGSYTITNTNSIQNIQSIRFRLSPLNSENNGNIVTKYDNWDSQNVPNTFISDEIKLEVVQINVDYTWFNSVTLAFQGEQTWNNFLNDENGQEQFIQAINAYETSIKNNISNDTIKNIIQIKYSLSENDSDYVDANDLYNQLKQKWENYDGENGGIIALYNNNNITNTYATKIYVKFELNDKYAIGNYELNPSNQQGNNYIKKTNINFKINLKNYIDILESTKTNITQNGNGLINNFIPPAMTGNGFLGGKTFDEIVELLKKFSIGVQYQKTDGSWTEKKSEITSYDPANPIIKIRFTVNSNNYNVQVTTTGYGTIASISSEFTLKLNVPLLIQWDDNILNNFKTNNFITGNTKNIDINETKEQELIQEIANYNSSNLDNNDLWNDLSNYLEIKYAIGNATNITQYHSRNDFINYLNNLNQTQYNNQINIKLVLKDSNIVDNEAKFILDSNADQNHILYQNDNTNIKIFIINNYTDLLSQIQIAPNSTSSNISFIYPEELNKVKNGQIIGLQLAYSLNSNIAYDSTIGTNIDNDWVTTEPTLVPTSATILKIKVYVNDTSRYVFDGKTIGEIDLTKIPKPIDVDSNWFSETPLIISQTNKYLNNLTINDITNWENQIWEKSKAIKADSSLKNQVSIKYTIESESIQYDANSLLDKLKQMQQDYSSSNLGIVYLWDGTRGIKINATFTSNSDLIIFSDIGGNTNNNLTGQVNTDQIKTYIDLSNYANVLNTNKTSVQLKEGQIGTIETFTPPTMTGNGFLGGKTFDQIGEVLNELGIEFKFNNDLNNDWNVKNDVNSYNQSNPILYIGVEYNQAKPNIVLNFENNVQIENTTLNKGDNALITLQLQAPTSINVDLSKLNDLSFQGNTKNINNADQIRNKINEIVNNVKLNNSSAIVDGDLNLEIRFSLNNIQLETNYGSNSQYTDDGIWYTFDKLNEILLSSTINYNSNKVLAKFYIKNNPILDGGINKYQLSDSNEQIINEEELSGSNIQFKIYINSTIDTNIDWIFANLKITGTQENFTISNYDSWIDNVPKGLTVQFNITPSSDIGTNGGSQPDDSAWKDDLNEAKPINTTRDFWIRFKVGSAYVFESASSSNSSYSGPIKLDASSILVSLKIESKWLNQIKLTGNLKDLIINDYQAIEAIKSAGQMPIENIIQIEYTYNGTNWLKKNEFVAKLEELKGARDDVNWIILREDIKARFVLNKTINDPLGNNKYILEVDNIIIDENNSNNIEISLITTNNNSTVKGYINLDKFDEFVAGNFKVTGTNSNANLIISNANAINAKLNPYSSNNIFSILYKWNSSSAYDPNNKIWIPGKELTETMSLRGTYENRFFGIQFKVDDTNYDLYQDDTEQKNNEYEIKTPAIQMQISVEIINPFTSTSSQIEIKFLDSNSQPQWYNNDGAFTFSIEKSQTSKENQIFNSLSEFLSSLLNSSYTQQMKDALELVYYVSAAELSEEEYSEATSINEINKYDKSNEKYNIWKTLDESNDISQLNYHLKVGDYVIIALRIKEDSLTTDANPNGYVLKDNDHSPTQAIRVSGYKVHTNYIDVDWNSMRLRNIGLAESASYGLDGYAMLDQISL